jgi:hypothetical protein
MKSISNNSLTYAQHNITKIHSIDFILLSEIKIIEHEHMPLKSNIRII